MYLWHSLLVLWVIILREYKSLGPKLHFRWDSVIQYVVIAGRIQFSLHLVQIFDLAIGKSLFPHIVTEPPSCFSIGCRGCSFFSNTWPRVDPPIWLKYFKLWFVSPKNLIPLFYCPILLHLGPLELFDIVLLPQKCFFDRNSAIYFSVIFCKYSWVISATEFICTQDNGMITSAFLLLVEHGRNDTSVSRTIHNTFRHLAWNSIHSRFNTFNDTQRYP